MSFNSRVATNLSWASCFSMLGTPKPLLPLKEVPWLDVPNILNTMELMTAPVVCMGLHCVISWTFSFMQICQITSMAKVFTVLFFCFVFFSLLSLNAFIQSSHEHNMGHLEITGLINSEFKTTTS